MPRKKIDFNVVRAIAIALPDVEASTIHRAPSLKVRGRLLTCPALHRSAEPNTLAVRIDFDQRAELMAAEPDVYYVTDHYLNYPTVLVRLSRIAEDPPEINIRFFPTGHWLIGMGHDRATSVQSAIGDAVFQITGKRFRDLPYSKHDLTWS